MHLWSFYFLFKIFVHLSLPLPPHTKGGVTLKKFMSLWCMQMSLKKVEWIAKDSHNSNAVLTPVQDQHQWKFIPVIQSHKPWLLNIHKRKEIYNLKLNPFHKVKLAQKRLVKISYIFDYFEIQFIISTVKKSPFWGWTKRS